MKSSLLWVSTYLLSILLYEQPTCSSLFIYNRYTQPLIFIMNSIEVIESGDTAFEPLITQLMKFRPRCYYLNEERGDAFGFNI
jgi:hypothetical protein